LSCDSGQPRGKDDKHIREVKARGAVVLAIAKESNKQVCKVADVVVTIPDVDSFIAR